MDDPPDDARAADRREPMTTGRALEAEGVGLRSACRERVLGSFSGDRFQMVTLAQGSTVLPRDGQVDERLGFSVVF